MSLLKNIFSSPAAARPRQGGHRFASNTVNARSLASNRIRNKGKLSSSESERQFAMAKVDRLTNDWIAVGRSINWNIRQGAAVIRARARQLAYEDGYTKKYLYELVKNVIGPDGFVMKNRAFDWISVIDPNGKKKPKKVWNREINSVIEESFWEWCDLDYCSLTKDLHFNELCNVILATVAVDGEIFIKKIKGKKYNKFGFTLQLIEADYIDEAKNAILSNGSYIQMGIQYNKYHQVEGYHVIISSAQSELYGSRLSGQTEFVPAEEIIHLYRKETSSQKRGLSWLLPAGLRLKMLSAYEEAELVNARVAANATLYLYKKDNSNPQFDGQTKDSDGNVISSISPGEAFVAPDGYEVGQFDPKFPAEQDGPFRKGILRGASAAFDMSYNLIGGDYEAVNYSSGKLSRNSDIDGWKLRQFWFIYHFLNRISPDWFEMAVLSGCIDLPDSNYSKYNKIKYFGRAWEGLEPEKEAKANQIKEERYYETLTNILAKQGYDIEEVLETIAEERELIASYGLPQRDTKNNVNENVEKEDGSEK